MSVVKVGDRVRITNDFDEGDHLIGKCGTVQAVEERGDWPICVELDDCAPGEAETQFNPDELEVLD